MEETLLNIFFAYSREDSKLRERLDKHLSGLKRRNYINTWYDGQIDAGTEWEKEIDYALSKADIILLLISADFIASDYCYEVEMRKAISRHEKGDAVIIPVMLHPCDWTDLPFSKIQGLPQNGKAVSSTEWKNPEFALNEVAKSIKDTVGNLRKTKNKQLRAVNEVLHEKDHELRITLEQLDELQLEQEILRETIQNLQTETNSLESDKTQLEIAITELDSAFKDREVSFQKLTKSEQTELNKIKSEKQKTASELSKLHDDLNKLEVKKANIKNDIDRMQRRN